MQEQPSTPAGLPGDPGDKWQVRVVDLVEDTVGTVHDRYIRPLLVAGRALVFGIVIFAMTLVVGVLLSIALIRVLTVYVFGGRVWAADLLVGGLLCGAGIALWTLRRSREAV